jgi:hypothetical protein
MVTTEYRPERCLACGTTYTSFACPECNRTPREIPTEERRGVQPDPQAAALVRDACAASEVFTDDELEAAATARRKGRDNG